MRAISSVRLVGALLPPWKAPVEGLVGAGKIPPYLPPAVSNAVALVLIMQSGMVLLGKGEPGVIPAGATPPGQLANWPAIPVGTSVLTALPLYVVGRTAPVPAPFASGYELAKGTWMFRRPPSISFRHSMLPKKKVGWLFMPGILPPTLKP